MSAKSGPAHHAAKLTETQARAILARVRDGEKQARLAEEFGVSRATISNLVSGVTWKHLRRTKS